MQKSINVQIAILVAMASISIFHPSIFSVNFVESFQLAGANSAMISFIFRYSYYKLRDGGSYKSFGKEDEF